MTNLFEPREPERPRSSIATSVRCESRRDAILTVELEQVEYAVGRTKAPEPRVAAAGGRMTSAPRRIRRSRRRVEVDGVVGAETAARTSGYVSVRFVPVRDSGRTS